MNFDNLLKRHFQTEICGLFGKIFFWKIQRC